MSGVFIHDGRRSGHHTWAVNAISAGMADGIFISPFASPRFRIPRYMSGLDFGARASGAGGEIVFDPMTHARFLPGANRTDLYDTWELWGADGARVDTALQRQQHVERVFARQSELGAPSLAPTISIDAPGSMSEVTALELGWVAQGIDQRAWQSFAASRNFLRSGIQLDAHVGNLVELRSPTWIITVSNEMVVDQSPDLSDHAAFEGLLRTIHSLSQRSRVIVAYSDFSGLLGVAAGADTVGAGWDRSMRTLDPAAFHVDSDAGIRIPASYVTQRGLSAVLRRDAAEAIDAWNPAEATRIRGGSMPPSDQIERLHHLGSLRHLVELIRVESDRALRVGVLRSHYETAISDFDRLIAAVGPAVKTADKTSWSTHQYQVLRDYASAEGLWTP